MIYLKKNLDVVLDVKRVVDMAMHAGRILLKNGGEIFRVEETIKRICGRFHVNHVDIFSMSHGIFVSAENENGEAYTKVNHVPLSSSHLGINLEKGTVLWKQSNNSKIHNSTQISMPQFKSGLNTGDIWGSTFEALTYLRTGNNAKKLIILSNLIRDNGENTTLLGTLRESFQNMELIDTTETAWIYKPLGKSLQQEESEQYYDQWERYFTGPSNTRN